MEQKLPIQVEIEQNYMIHVAPILLILLLNNLLLKLLSRVLKTRLLHWLSQETMRLFSLIPSHHCSPWIVESMRTRKCQR